MADAIATLPKVAALGQMEQAMHFLKGSSASLGFESFSNMCRDGEKMAADGRGADIDLASLAAEFQQSKTAFLQGISH